ncbi:hypothetical protein J3E68DRAFT_404210 [Trichoderma sp. SZMC 28012]
MGIFRFGGLMIVESLFFLQTGLVCMTHSALLSSTLMLHAWYFEEKLIFASLPVIQKINCGLEYCLVGKFATLFFFSSFDVTYLLSFALILQHLILQTNKNLYQFTSHPNQSHIRHIQLLK